MTDPLPPPAAWWTQEPPPLNRHPLQNLGPCSSSSPRPPALSSTHPVLPWSAILSPNLSISHFRLGELLGRGATSEVYAAFTDLSDFASLSLAIKRIPMVKLATTKDIARVQAEIQTQLLAQHPSIVRLYAAFRDKDHIYLVLELCESGTLADYLDARGKLTEPEVRYVLDAVIRGLLYLRRQGKFHRDVKPGNIMLTANHDVKIGDLGLVAPIQSPSTRQPWQNKPQQQRATHLGAQQHTVCGTINYMAPEVVANQPYSETVDMWSLGCLLVTMLKGRPPFEPPNASNEDSYDVRIKTLRGLVDGHYTLPKDLSKDVRDLIASLLQKNPERRMTLERILEHAFFAPGLPMTRLPDAPIMGQLDQRPLQLDNSRSRVGGTGASVVSRTGRPPLFNNDQPSHHRIEYSVTTDCHRQPPARAMDQDPLSSDSARAALPRRPPNPTHMDPYAHPPSSYAPSRPPSVAMPQPHTRPVSTQPLSIHSNSDRPVAHPHRAPAPVVDLVPIQPLSTRYLRPISHDGQTVAISLRAPRSDSATSGATEADPPDLDVYITSKRDGTRLVVSPSHGGRISVHFASTGESRTYMPGSSPGLPRGLVASLYEGALKFAAKARGVSPRVTLYSPRATVALMVNGDVDARFAEADVRVKLTDRRTLEGGHESGRVRDERVQVWQGSQLMVDNVAARADAEAKWQAYVAHVRLAARQCEAALAEHVAAVRRGQVKDRNAPLVIKTAAGDAQDAWARGDAEQAPPALRGRPRVMSPLPTPDLAPTGARVPPGATAASSRAPSTTRSDSGYYTSHHGSTVPPARRSGSVVSTRSSLASAGSAGSSGAPLLNMYMPGIGWFSRHPGGCEQYTLMFVDGALVTVQHSMPRDHLQGAGWVKYAPPPPARAGGAALVQPRMYPLTQGLPGEVKERLAQYRVCVAEFRRLVKDGAVGGRA